MAGRAACPRAELGATGQRLGNVRNGLDRISVPCRSIQQLSPPPSAGVFLTKENPAEAGSGARSAPPCHLAALPDSAQPPLMSGGYNFHSVYMAIEVLLVECKQCNRRAALTKADGLPIWQGNMDEIRSKRL